MQKCKSIKYKTTSWNRELTTIPMTGNYISKPIGKNGFVYHLLIHQAGHKIHGWIMGLYPKGTEGRKLDKVAPNIDAPLWKIEAKVKRNLIKRMLYNGTMITLDPPKLNPIKVKNGDIIKNKVDVEVKMGRGWETKLVLKSKVKENKIDRVIKLQFEKVNWKASWSYEAKLKRAGDMVWWSLWDTFNSKEVVDQFLNQLKPLLKKYSGTKGLPIFRMTDIFLKNYFKKYQKGEWKLARDYIRHQLLQIPHSYLHNYWYVFAYIIQAWGTKHKRPNDWFDIKGKSKNVYEWELKVSSIEDKEKAKKALETAKKGMKVIKKGLRRLFKVLALIPVHVQGEIILKKLSPNPWSIPAKYKFDLFMWQTSAWKDLLEEGTTIKGNKLLVFEEAWTPTDFVGGLKIDVTSVGQKSAVSIVFQGNGSKKSLKGAVNYSSSKAAYAGTSFYSTGDMTIVSGPNVTSTIARASKSKRLISNLNSFENVANFKKNEYCLSDKEKNVLRSFVAEHLYELSDPKTKVTIEGHVSTDERPSRRQSLSINRATEVKNFIIHLMACNLMSFKNWYRWSYYRRRKILRRMKRPLEKHFTIIPKGTTESSKTKNSTDVSWRKVDIQINGKLSMKLHGR